jgi:signal transduction histidine kinase
MNAEAPVELHDPGPADGRLLAELFSIGMVAIDQQLRCRSANPRACRLLGAADEAALRNDWESVRAALALPDLSLLRASGPPLVQRADVGVNGDARRLRFEVHRVDDDGAISYLMLLRPRSVEQADRAQLLASEAQINPFVVTGLVHDAKGSLNNFTLTLALLNSAISRFDASPASEPVLAKCRRYLEVLQTEVSRLSSSLTGMHTFASSADAGTHRIDVNAVIRDVVRLLRHAATLREATIELDPHAHTAWISGDEHQIRLALLGLGTWLVECAPPGAVITLGTSPPRVADFVTAYAKVSGAMLPQRLRTDLYRISRSGDSTPAAPVAARLVVEAHGGQLDITVADGSGFGFAIDLPADREHAAGVDASSTDVDGSGNRYA